jgi:Fe-only nitrogenase accessory protein AnfO
MCQKRTDRKGPEIATILDGSGCSSDLSEPGTIVVFQKQGCSFEAVREMGFTIHHCVDLKDLRHKVAELLEFMGSCRILVARSVHGALYFELEKAGISTWEISGRPEDFLGQVWNDEEHNLSGAEPVFVADIPAPEQKSPGYFFISIREVQVNRPEISSKQVLQQFVQQGAFTELEIVCDHVPPWIEVEALRRGYELVKESIASHEQKVIIRNLAGGGCC